MLLVKLKVQASDAKPSCGTATVVITIKTAKGKKVATIKKSGVVTNAWVTISYKVASKVKAGKYFMYIAATDGVGNAQTKLTKVKLTIK